MTKMSIPKRKKAKLSGKSLIWFLAIEAICFIGGVLYLGVLATSIGLALGAMLLAVPVAIVMSFIGLFVARITHIKWLYFLLHAMVVYPILSAWIAMTHEEDLLQVLVDFFVLSPMLGGLFLSLPTFMLLIKRKSPVVETPDHQSIKHM